jgi:hypothetical protein
MKKGKAKNQTIHIQGTKQTTLCGKPIASSVLWAKKNPPTKEHPGLCKKCCGLFLKAKPDAPQKGAAKKTAEPEAKKSKRTPALASLEVAPKELVVTYKGTEHKATVNSDGTITVNGKTFNSPSRAGKEVTGREVDGWTFWRYEVPGEGLKKLDTLRK